ncbi:alkaline phosphatase D family protein [Tunicatimonas pelagia]|uniref:alkaline phosphatase D family protein n=1 Tax=Tunicatimonas pelagia TaxID=931531 RepID=UPI002666CF3D|nr:alkaline phosphatase D family protein [Tunicatimonas pelagia]WKN42077.1 alkaline phosphatase D family protein [Tunicatimonas pelagia]
MLPLRAFNRTTINYLFAPVCGLIALVACQTSQPSQEEAAPAYQVQNIAYDESIKPFYHGVASGDPLTDRVIIWTRVTPETIAPIDVAWQVATDSTFTQVVQTDELTTSENQDFTVKVDVSDLVPDQIYYYRFRALGANSPVGRTKTAPDAAQDSLRLAFASCSNYEFGYFNAYGHMAQQPIFDAVVHLGDYIYEYAVGVYGDTAQYGRVNVPTHEIVTLEDYRARYALYRADPELQAAHASHPWITIWDDHEISNDAYTEGAENHDATEGNYQDRRQAAVQAYYEWLPVRGKPNDPLYRSFSFGSLAHLMVLDGRLAGRTIQADTDLAEVLLDSSRTMLGQAQREWLQQQFASTEAAWKVLGNQVIFSGLDASQLPNTPDKFTDMWDGYPVERAQLIDFLKEQGIENLIVGTGDFHSSLGMEIPDDPFHPNTYNRSDERQRLGVEFVVHSVNASNINEWVGADTVAQIRQAYLSSKYNPHIRHANLSDHGYVELLLTPQAAEIHWKYLNTLSERDYSLKQTHMMRVPARSSRLEPPA